MKILEPEPENIEATNIVEGKTPDQPSAVVSASELLSQSREVSLLANS